MGDRSCAWCDRSLSGDGRRQYCPRPRTCRQAAYRARRRAREAIRPRVAMFHIGSKLQAHALALDEMLPELAHREIPAPGVHCEAAAGFRHLVDELVRCAVLADREAGATWADIGRALGVGADAARHRYGHLRLLWPPPPDSD